MRFYLEYINHLGRLQKKSAHRRLQAGFTITEVLLAGLMMLIAVLVAGIGLINLLRSNYRANADSEIRNNLNRTLEFVSDEVRRARIIANSQAAIITDKVPGWKGIPGARAVLAFQIPDPRNPNNLLVQQIVYYTRNPENSLTSPRVLSRYGPNLDPNGNYTTPANVDTWQHSPVTDMLAEDASNPDCPADFTRIPAKPGNVDDFYTCVHTRGNQVILNANAQVKMTTNDEVKYSVNTRVFTRACQIFCLTNYNPTPPFYKTPGSGSTTPTLPIVTVPAKVTAEVIKGGTCTFSTSCGVLAAPDKDWFKDKTRRPDPEGAFGSRVLANAGDGIVVFVDGLRNVHEDPTEQTVEVYTADSNNLPPDSSSLTKNQILFVFTTKTTPPNSYQILVTIEPQ